MVPMGPWPASAVTFHSHVVIFRGAEKPRVEFAKALETDGKRNGEVKGVTVAFGSSRERMERVEVLERASQGRKREGWLGEEAAGFMSLEFRGEGQPGGRNVGGVSCFGHSFPYYFIPGKGPAPPGELMLAPLGPLPTCPLSLRRSKLLGRVGTSAPSSRALSWQVLTL